MAQSDQTVRHQPITAMNSLEAVDKLDQLYNKLLKIAWTFGIETPGHVSFAFPRTDIKIDPAKMLLAVTELHYLVHSLFLTTGLAQFESRGMAELHKSNMSTLWPDGAKHKDSGGRSLLPGTYVAPDMSAALNHFTPPLFADHKPSKEVIHLDDSSTE